MRESPLRRPTAAALASSAVLACLAACGIDWTVPAAQTGAGGSSDGGGGAASEAPGSTTSATSTSGPSGSTASGDGGAPQGGSTSETTGSDGQGAGNGEGANDSGSGETVTTGGGDGCGDAGCEDCQLCAIDGGGPCREAFEACENQEACAALIDCAAGCAPEEEACIANCFEEFPEGGDAADLVLGCVLCEVCSNTCGASPHC